MTRISYEARQKVVRAHIQNGRTIASLWLSTTYPEPLFPTQYDCIAKNAKTMMRRSLSWR